MGSRTGTLGAVAPPLTVLHVLSPFSPGETGGADEHVADLASCQLHAGRVRPVVLSLGAKGYSERMSALGVAAVDTAPARPVALRTLAAMLDRFDVAVVHSHGYDADFLTAHARARRATRDAAILATVHGLVTQPFRNAAKTAANLGCLPLLDGVIVTASRDLRRPWPLPRTRRFFVANGIAQPARNGRARLRDALSLPPGTPVVGFCGRLAPEKRPDLFVRAAAELALRHPDARFVGVGAGPELERLRRLADALGLDGRLELLGFRRDAVELVAGFDVLLCPSDREGTPRAALEAMAQGVAVVASRVGGLTDLIRDGVDGALVPRRSVDALVAAADGLLRDERRRTAIGTAAAARVGSRFTREAMADGVEEVYRRVLARRGRDISA
jgi:L-malate glycosyltransferase